MSKRRITKTMTIEPYSDDEEDIPDERSASKRMKKNTEVKVSMFPDEKASKIPDGEVSKDKIAEDEVSKNTIPDEVCKITEDEVSSSGTDHSDNLEDHASDISHDAKPNGFLDSYASEGSESTDDNEDDTEMKDCKKCRDSGVWSIVHDEGRLEWGLLLKNSPKRSACRVATADGIHTFPNVNVFLTQEAAIKDFPSAKFYHNRDLEPKTLPEGFSYDSDPE